MGLSCCQPAPCAQETAAAAGGGEGAAGLSWVRCCWHLLCCFLSVVQWEQRPSVAGSALPFSCWGCQVGNWHQKWEKPLAGSSSCASCHQQWCEVHLPSCSGACHTRQHCQERATRLQVQQRFPEAQGEAEKLLLATAVHVAKKGAPTAGAGLSWLGAAAAAMELWLSCEGGSQLLGKHTCWWCSSKPCPQSAPLSRQLLGNFFFLTTCTSTPRFHMSFECVPIVLNTSNTFASTTHLSLLPVCFFLVCSQDSLFQQSVRLATLGKGP
jgi:hypothetical protein